MPIFVVSSVTGLGLPVLHAFLNALPALPHAATPLLEPTPQGSGTTDGHDSAWGVPSAEAPSGQQKAEVRGVANGVHKADVSLCAHGHQSEGDVAATAGQQRAGAIDCNMHHKADATSGQQQPDERGPANGQQRAEAGSTAIERQQPLDERGPANGHSRADAGSMQHSWQQAAVTHFQVDHTFEVKGVGCVVSGTVVSGEVAVHQTLNLGPMGEGGFRQVQVTCIHRSQVKLFCLPPPLAML